SLSNLAAMLRFNLLTYQDLWVWLNQPYQIPRPQERLSDIRPMCRYRPIQGPDRRRQFHLH
ncbi:MAG: hypothetical protein JXB18_14330, partial [Sedimentisphaerales bacterium]|nr:hypothetical protein [Sedimentisphaerales bacterium]